MAFRIHFLCYRLMTAMKAVKKSLSKLYPQLFQKLLQMQDFSLYSCVMSLFECCIPRYRLDVKCHMLLMCAILKPPISCHIT